MPDAKTKKVVELIIAATNDKISESDLTQSLVTAGVNPSDAPGLISKVRDGFKAGV